MPNSSIQNIVFYDNGTHGDQVANDGIYCSLFTSTSLQGTYNIEIHANGIASSSTNFERTAVTSFTASPASVVIKNGLTDQGIDTTQNGKFDLIRFTIPMSVTVAKEYCLTASLTDSNDACISLINSGSVQLYVDANSIMTVDVNSKEIVRHNINGSYILKNIQIHDGNTGLIVATKSDYNTTSYQISQFEPIDTDGDGLPDNLERTIGTDPNKPDSDEDGATDYQEISLDGNSLSFNHQTDSNPLIADTDKDGMPDGYEITYRLSPLVDDRFEDFDGDELTNTEEYDLHTRPDSIDTDGDGRNDKWEVLHLTNPLVYENYTKITGDIDLDAVVNTIDLRIIANQWLQSPGSPSADIAPQPNGDGIVNLLDFALLAEDWMK